MGATMQDLIIPIFIALSVASAVWGISQLLTNRVSGEKKKLQSRLSIEQQADAMMAPAKQSIRVQSDIKGLSGVLARQPIFYELYRALLQTWPEMALTKFLAIVFCCGVVMFVVLGGLFNSVAFGVVASLLGMYVPFLVLTAKRN